MATFTTQLGARDLNKLKLSEKVAWEMLREGYGIISPQRLLLSDRLPSRSDRRGRYRLVQESGTRLMPANGACGMQVRKHLRTPSSRKLRTCVSSQAYER